MNSTIIISTTTIARIRWLEKHKEKPSTLTILNVAGLILSILSMVVFFRTWIWLVTECGTFQLSLNPTKISRDLLLTALALNTLTWLVRNQIVYFRVFRLGKTERLRKAYIYTITACWSVTVVFDILTAEFEMASKFIVDKSTNEPVDTSSVSHWGVGQVMALVMLGLPVWDILTYWYKCNKERVDDVLCRLPFLGGYFRKRLRPEGRDEMEIGMLEQRDVEQRVEEEEDLYEIQINASQGIETIEEEPTRLRFHAM